MIVILIANSRYEWVLIAFLTSDLIINSFRIFLMFKIGHALSHGTTLSLIELSLSISEREFRTDHTTSLCRLTSRFYILSLICTTLASSSRSFRVIFTSPSLAIAFVLSSITSKIPSGVHHGLEIHIVINTSRNISIVFSEFFKCNSEVSSIVISNVMMLLKCLQEFSKYLLFSLSTIHNSWMLFGIINTN